MVDTELQPSTEGTMQGGPLSPLLANISLDDFDKELESRGLRSVRYADDFLVFTKTTAFTHGMSSKGPWVLSSSQAVHQALPVALSEERGLPSLLAIWKKLTAKSRTA